MCKLFFVYFFCVSTFFIVAQDTLKNPKITFSEMNIGLAYRNVAITSENIETANFAAVLGSVQHGFLYTILKHKFTNKKILFSDFILCELLAGYLQTTNPSDFRGIWATYNFKIGIAGIYKIHKNHDMGINLAIFSFGKEISKTFFSGSSLTLKYRYKKIQTELELASPEFHYYGWALNLNRFSNPKQLAITFKWLYSNSLHLGFQSVFLPIFSINSTDNGNENVWHIKLFWGTYF